jgi:hypothetical protein
MISHYSGNWQSYMEEIIIATFDGPEYEVKVGRGPAPQIVSDADDIFLPVLLV